MSRYATRFAGLWMLAWICCDVAAAQSLTPERQTAVETVDIMSSESHLMAQKHREYSETALLETE